MPATAIWPPPPPPPIRVAAVTPLPRKPLPPLADNAPVTVTELPARRIPPPEPPPAPFHTVVGGSLVPENPFAVIEATDRLPAATISIAPPPQPPTASTP